MVTENMEQNSPKKRKPGYTVVDSVVLIGLLILLYFLFLLIFGGIDRISQIGKKDENQVELSCVLRLENMDLEVYGIDPSQTQDCPFLHVGDKVYLDGSPVGEIVRLEYENCVMAADNAGDSGQLIYATDPYSLNILVTVKMNGSQSDSGYSVGEVPLYIGDNLTLSTAEFQREATISFLEIYEESDGQEGDQTLPDAIPAGQG